MDHSSCTIQSARFRRLHYIREDLEMIADKDPLNASTLRIAQQKTDIRIKYLRERYGIPANQLPPEDMLWLNDLTVRELERWSLRNRGKTTYARALATKRRHERLPRSLVELGYLRTRFVAYRDNKAVPACVATEIRHDEYGMFILVDDFWGNYQGNDGSTHDATTEGYSVVIQQFLYCFEAVNAAIAVLDGVAPSKPLLRWQQKTSPGQEAHRNNVSHVASDAKENTSTVEAVSGGNLNSATEVSVFTDENTTETRDPSMITQKVRDSSDLRTAPWTVETLIALASAVLPVPDPAVCDAATWDKEWQRPAKLLLAATETLSPQLAWERVDLTIRWMVDASSPSWWRTGRTKQTPTSLRHVQEHYRQYYDDYKKSDWHPTTPTPYDGPPLEYEFGYTGITQATEKNPAEPPIIVEEPEELPRQPWMTREEATDLCNEIWDACALMPSLTPSDSTQTQWYASMQWGPGKDDWLDFADPDAWRLPSPETVDRIEQALRFAAERNAIPAEVGVIEQPEPPPIILEATPDDVPAPDDEEHYVSMDELSVELQRGLRPLSSSPSVEVAPVVAKSPPAPKLPGKAGMSLMIAGLLLGQIESAGYAAQLCPISDDRATLTVEASPGQWIDIDSSASWQRHLKSVAQSPPPGSVSVIAMGSMGQAMEVAQ